MELPNPLTYSLAERRSDGWIWNADGYWEAAPTKHEEKMDSTPVPDTQLKQVRGELRQLYLAHNHLLDRVITLEHKPKQSKPKAGPDYKDISI